MCSRFHLQKKHYREMLAQLGIADPPEVATRYNIPPGSAIPAVRSAAPSGQREVCALRWGLVPSWAKSDEPAARLINARAETLAAKPSFRAALRTRRCIVPASGFFEWETDGRIKRPWLFRWRDESPFGFAGLWEKWHDPDGRTVESCAVITTEANALLRAIHDRMPVMLTPAQWHPWLDPGTTDPAALLPLLRPPPAETMVGMRVNPCVSHVRNDLPECLAPAPADDDAASAGDAEAQLPLW